MITNMIVTAIFLIASLPIHVGDTVEWHIAGYGSAELLGLSIINAEGETRDINCNRDPSGNKDGHWICPWVAEEGEWRVNFISYWDKKGKHHIWQPKFPSTYPIADVTDPNPDPDPDPGTPPGGQPPGQNVSLYMPYIGSGFFPHLP